MAKNLGGCWWRCLVGPSFSLRTTAPGCGAVDCVHKSGLEERRGGQDEQGGIQLRPKGGEERRKSATDRFFVVAWERPIGRSLSSRSPEGISQQFGNCTRRTATNGRTDQIWDGPERSHPLSARSAVHLVQRRERASEETWQNRNART